MKLCGKKSSFTKSANLVVLSSELVNSVAESKACAWLVFVCVNRLPVAVVIGDFGGACASRCEVLLPGSEGARLLFSSSARRVFEHKRGGGSHLWSSVGDILWELMVTYGWYVCAWLS